MESGELILPDEEIASVLSMFFENVTTTHELRELKPEFVQTVYCNFLQDFGVSLDQSNLLPLDVSDSVRQYPQAYQSIGRMMVLAKMIRVLLQRMKCDIEFKPGDFISPKPKRTRVFFTRLIQFYSFVQDHIDRLFDTEMQMQFKIEGKEKLIEKLAEKREKLKELKRENEETNIREEQMMKRIAEVNGEIHEQQVKMGSFKNQVEQLRVDIATFTTNVKAGEVAILEKKELLEKLASQVMQDSEFKEIEDLENHVAKYKSEDTKAANIASLKETLQISKSAAELLKNELMPTLQEIQEAITLTNEINAELSQQDTVMKLSNEEIGDHDMKIQHLEEILSTRQEKLSQLPTAWNVKKGSVLEEINQLKLTLEKIMQNQSEDEIALQDLMKERARVIRVTQLFKEQTHQFDITVATYYQKILQAMEVHNSEIQEALESLQETISKRSERD